MRKTSKKQKQAKEPEKISPPEKQPEKEKTFDFGGLPARDLKKNLGCG